MVMSLRRMFEPWIDTDYTMCFPSNQETDKMFHGFSRLDVVDKEKEYVVSVDLPGMKKEDVTVTIRDNVLFIEAERKKKEVGETDTVRWEERYHGKTKRSIKLLPTCDSDKVKSTFSDGVLELVFPKKPESQTHKQIKL